jgi:ligand-binding sensor domain-containing protein
MIDKNNKVKTFDQSETPLKETAITNAVEDENGNVYFALYAYIHSDQRDRPEEGFARLSKDGKWTHYNDINSGLPADYVNSLWYDKFEKVLWIGTNEAGLVRYDLKDGWENYHNKNSKVSSSYIFQITQDSKGNLYVATFNGMMRIARKR